MHEGGVRISKSCQHTAPWRTGNLGGDRCSSRNRERTWSRPATEQAQRGTPRLLLLLKTRRNQVNLRSIKESQQESKLSGDPESWRAAAARCCDSGNNPGRGQGQKPDCRRCSCQRQCCSRRLLGQDHWCLGHFAEPGALGSAF